jgi:3-deoxy-D-manno-octulosonic-acid transferase
MFWLYNVLWLLAFPGVLSYLILRSAFSGKYRQNLGARLGSNLSTLSQGLGSQVIWVHALSVGEVLSAVTLVRNLRDEFPQYEILITTTSEAGQLVARQRLASLNCQFSYLPLDLWWLVRRMVKTVGASIFVLVETDLWPNLFWCLAEEQIPIILVNGRISDRSFARYRLVKTFVSEVFNRINVVGVQSEEDVQRMRMLGVDPTRIRLIGNLKFDQHLDKTVETEKEELVNELGWMPPTATWIAGSTHPGEEEAILKVYTRLKKEFSDLCLILAPRSQQRFGEVFGLVKRSGWLTIRRTQLSPEKGRRLPVDVLVLDTIGELARFYSLADFAFVGGSLVRFGGHNPLEAVHRGLPVVFGPHMDNFREIAAVIGEAGGGFQVCNDIELYEQLRRWLLAPASCKEQGRAAQAALEVHRGAVARSMNAIRDTLKKA